MRKDFGSILQSFREASTIILYSGGFFVAKKIAWGTGAGLLFLLLMFWYRKPLVIPVSLFYDSGDPADAVVSRQALQSVVLAMEFFNSRSTSRFFVPFRETDLDLVASVERAVERSSAAVVGGINAPFALQLSGALKRHGLPFLSLSSAASLALPNDLVFRPRPGDGARELGIAARKMGISSYSVIVSGFDSSRVQEFIRGFEMQAGMPPRRTMVFSGDLNKHIEDFERIARGMDAILLVLPDWPAAVAIRELRLRLPHLPVFTSNWAISHRTHLLAGALGEGAITTSFTPEEWDQRENEFVRFVSDTYGADIPPLILAMGYDTVALLDEAVRRAGSAAPHAVARALEELEHVNTAGGTVPMNENGDMQRPASLFTLSAGGWIRISDPETVSLSSKPGIFGRLSREEL